LVNWRIFTCSTDILCAPDEVFRQWIVTGGTFVSFQACQMEVAPETASYYDCCSALKEVLSLLKFLSTFIVAQSDMCDDAVTGK